MSKRTHNPNQSELFANYGDAIKAHHLKRLRELRDEFAERAKASEHKRRVLENTRKAEDWDAIKRACNRL
jgi:hypothetical protein